MNIIEIRSFPPVEHRTVAGVCCVDEGDFYFKQVIVYAVKPLQWISEFVHWMHQEMKVS